jgi:cell division septation protein DedD
MNDRTREENMKVQARPDSSSLKSIAAKFWKRTVKDIKTSIPSGKPASEPKSMVAGGNSHATRKQGKTSSTKSLEKIGKISNKIAKTPDLRPKSNSESTMKVLGDRQGLQAQPKISSYRKVASKPQKDAAKERKTLITRSGVISKGNSMDENDEKFVWAMPETSFPKLIRAKTTKNRIRESRIVISQTGGISKWAGTGENDKEIVWAMHKTTYPKLIRAKTIKYRVNGTSMTTPQNGSLSVLKKPIVGDEKRIQTASEKVSVSNAGEETAGFAPIPLAPSLPEETGVRGDVITGYSDKKLSYPYSLYLGSFRTEERAKRAIAFYSKNGFSAFRAKVEFRGKGVWYRVYGGHFKEAEQAYRFREKHELSEAKVRKTNYANLVGTYSNETKLKDKLSSLGEMGYSPYVIKGKNGMSSILLGAYITKKGAEQQSQELKSKGISVRVVRR